MLGWLILFALMAILAPLWSLTGAQNLASLIGCVLFGSLFFIGLVTRLARGRT
jgi:hypothetical protein